MLQTAYEYPGPALVRYPRGSGPVSSRRCLDTLPDRQRDLIREGSGTALLAFGSLVSTALEVGDRLQASVANMRFIKPLDKDLILQLADSHELLVTLEENVVQGGRALR